MKEIYDLLLLYVAKVWHYRRIAVLVAFAVCLIGWTVVDSLPDLYASKSQILVDQRTNLDEILGGIAVDDRAAESDIFDVARRKLTTRASLTEIVNATRFRDYAATENDMDRQISKLKDNFTIYQQATARGAGTSIINLAYEDPDPEVATEIVSAFQDVFIESVLGSKQRTTESTSRFITQQIGEYEELLRKSEERLRDFKRENVLLMPEEGQTYYTQLQRVTDEVRAAELELNQVQSQAAELKAQITQISQIRSGADPGSLSISGPYEDRIDVLEERLIDLLLRYTEEHPDVVALRRTIERLRTGGPILIGDDAVDAAALSGDPILEQLRIELSKADANVAAVQGKVDTLLDRKSTLEGAVSTMLEVEAELARLNRDYNVYRDQYQRLVRRREEARVASAADTSTSEISFQILEPPKVPKKPVDRGRARLATLVLVFGVGAGAGLAFVLSQIWSTFSTTGELRSLGWDFPVLGRIGMERNPEEQHRWMISHIAYGSAATVLLCLYGGILAVYINQGTIQGMFG